MLTTDLLGFAVCAVVIILSGTQLSKYGDRIADLTGLGKAWMGLILMSSVTSLPELINGISAVAVVKAPDLAAGDIFGSCVFNLLILALLDVLVKKPLTSMVQTSHLLAGAFGILLISLSGVALFLADYIPSIGWVSAATPVIIAVYLLAVVLIFKYEQKQLSAARGDTKKVEVQPGAVRKAVLYYIGHAAVVVGAAFFLPFFGEKLAEQSGLGDSFFGTLFIAATTSLPELVVSISAVRIGSLDIAVGNLFGSNVFNIFILALDDIFYTTGSLYRDISDQNLLSIFAVVIMTAVAAIGLLFRFERKRFYLATDALVILLLYILLVIALVFLG